MSRNKQSMHAELETALSELHLSTERWEAILAAAGRMTERENRRRPLRTGLMAGGYLRRSGRDRRRSLTPSTGNADPIPRQL